MEEIGSAGSLINSLCIKEDNLANKEKWSRIQLKFWKSLVKQYFTEFPNLSKLQQVMIATLTNTSPLERSYTWFQNIAAERRNQLQQNHLEVLYLLASLKDQVAQRNMKRPKNSLRNKCFYTFINIFIRFFQAFLT